MPALTFQKQFAGAVESGRKRQTIRVLRKSPIHEGDRLYLYTGMRTRHCRKLGETVVTEVLPIQIEWNPDLMTGRVVLAGRELRGADLDELIERDGFTSHWEFFNWFRRYGESFDGVVVRWPEVFKVFKEIK